MAEKYKINKRTVTEITRARHYKEKKSFEGITFKTCYV